MLVSDFWDARLKNWARVFGSSHRAGKSIAWACIQAAPEWDPEDLKQAPAQKPLAADADDAAAVEALICSPYVDQMARRFIVGIWAKHLTLGSFGYPKKFVATKVREAVRKMEDAEKVLQSSCVCGNSGVE